MRKKPSRKSRDYAQWIAVYITHNLQEAHIIAGKLQANEVPAIVHQEAGATALGITLGNLGEIKVLVSPADYEMAESLLVEASDAQFEANNDKIQLIWREDEDGAQYYVDDQDE